ncbi:MAG TPA: hypothetical protein VGJ51_01545 [Candidatus Angelobacter sp.]
MGKEVFNGLELQEATECVAELAKFFPGIVPVRIPVLILKGDSAKQVAEQTTIEFGTAEECLFVCGLPLEFEDLVQVRAADGTLDSIAKIVAMRLHDDKMAFAARFLNDVTNWIARAECRNVVAASGN